MKKPQTSPTRSHKPTETPNEDGFAAIIVTLIVMAIIVLITIGFVKLVSREQRSSLDRQLTTQAFYAAETGINEVARLLAEDPGLPSKDTCEVSDTHPDYPFPEGGVLDEEEAVAYTCVLIDPAPSTLEYDSIPTEHARNIYLTGVDDDGSPMALNTIVVNWNASELSDSPTFPAAGRDFPTDFGDGAPVLRVSLTPISGALSRNGLIDSTFTVFLRPESGGSEPTITYTAGAGQRRSQGDVTQVGCNDGNTPRYCKARITGLSGASQYVMSVRAIYSNASVQIDTPDGASFSGEQVVADVTGRANDVLRRMQVRLPIRDTFDFPGFTLEAGAGGICKPYSVRNDFGSVDEPSDTCDL